MSFLYPIKLRLLRAGKRLIPRVRPSFLIIGAQKCGTTSLFHHLSCHPSLVTPRIKEVNFFDADNRFARGTWFYHSYFPFRSLSTLGSKSFEATPSYMGGQVKTKKTVARLKQYNPSIKLVVILRNPIDRAYSAWQMYCRYYRLNPDWYFKWMERDDSNYIRENVICRPKDFGTDFKADIEFDLKNISNPSPYESPILEWGLYGAMLNLYRSHFPANQLHILFLEDLKENPIETLEKLNNFLDLPPHDWKKTPLKPENTGGDYPSLSVSCRTKLADFYESDVTSLAKLIDIKPPWLDFSPPA